MPSLPWTSRTPPNAWPPASFQSLKLCEFIPISAASALNPASVNSSSAALRIPSSIASAPTASSSPPSPTPPNLTILRRMVRCRGRRLGRFDAALRSRSPPLLVVIPNEVRDLLFPCPPLVYPEPRTATRHCSSQSMVGHVAEGLPPANTKARPPWLIELGQRQRREALRARSHHLSTSHRTVAG